MALKRVFVFIVVVKESSMSSIVDYTDSSHKLNYLNSQRTSYVVGEEQRLLLKSVTAFLQIKAAWRSPLVGV